ncbi:(5-formylfuran-3-yl)methyl phosphate synthase [Gimesia sp.]|uniref:(5-formylfuran-3-yl)methyl phosphate synthase n=1 Tax=Gimesia sp. TaxID=2024833 RepID=UPI0032EB887E
MNPRRVELLVSVRNCEEIAAALAGGCDLLDFKEPENGALGMVDSESLQAITVYCERHSITQPLSMALGELVEWCERPTMPRIPSAMKYLKLGLSETRTIPDWKSCWREVTERIETEHQRQFDWIAVAYADWEQASAAPPLEVLSAAIESRCAGLLIDTFHKQGLGLTDLLSLELLDELIQRAHRHGLKVALAGSIRPGDLETLSPLQPDIVGIRGAACTGNRRTSSIESSAVRDFRMQLQEQFHYYPSG